jgi:hypothetical protein
MEDPYMKKILTGIILVLLTSLLIGSSTGDFVYEPTVWNDPNWTGFSIMDINPFGYSSLINLSDYFNPSLPSAPVVKPENPVPIVMPTPLPFTKAEIINNLSKQKQSLLPSGKMLTIFF